MCFLMVYMCQKFLVKSITAILYKTVMLITEQGITVYNLLSAHCILWVLYAKFSGSVCRAVD